MSNRLLRTLIFLVALTLAAAVVLAALLQDAESPGESVATLVPGAAQDGGSVAPATEGAVDAPEPAGDPGEREAEAEGGEDSPPADLAAPMPPEVWREAYTLVVGDLIDIPVPSESALTQLQLREEGFSLNKEWWLVGDRHAGPEGCRDSTRSPPAQPVPLDILAVSEGWYACIDIDRFARFGQMHFLDVEPAGLVSVEVVIWDFAAIGE